MAKSYFRDGTGWRELVKGEQGEQGPVGPVGPRGPQGEQGPMGSVELVGDPSITVDTSVGTRVFIGDTMIYGDTGWHDIGNLVPSEIATDGINRVYIKRENSAVWISFDRSRPDIDIPANAPLLYIPQGFEPYSPVRMGAGSTYELGKAIYTVGNELRANAEVLSGNRRFYISWSATATWPLSLPG